MRNFPTHFWQTFQERRDEPAITVVGDEGDTATETYWEWTRRVQRIGAALHERGLEAGDRAALVAPNSRDWLDVACGAWLAGGVVVPVPADLDRSVTLRCLGRAGASWIVVQDASAYQRLRGQGGDVPDHLNWLLLEWDGETARGGAAVLPKLEENGRHLVARGRVDDLAEYIYRIDAGAPAVILYNSEPGSEPHGAFFGGTSFANMLTRLGRSLPVSEGSLVAVRSALSHPEALLLTVAALLQGRRLAVGASPENLAVSLDTVQPTHLVCGADSLLDETQGWREKIRHAPESDADGSDAEGARDGGLPLRNILSSLGGDAVDRLFRRPLRNAFGSDLDTIFLLGDFIPPDLEAAVLSADVDVLDVYGHPECGVSHLEQPGSRAPDAVGRPVEGYEARIVDPDADGIGEIEIASDVLFEDYWDGSGPRTVEEGWLRTGDRGRIEDGLLYLE